MGSLKDRAILILAVAVAAAIPAAASKVVTTPAVAPDVTGVGEASPLTAADVAAARRRDDFAAMQEYRPGYRFWQYVFTLPDNSIAYGSATDGRLLVTFPAKGEWTRRRRMDGSRTRPHPRWPAPRAQGWAIGATRWRCLLERVVGPVLHNSTRGDALPPNARRYGRSSREWGAIYERFGVPADIGLAQVILESGLSGRGVRKPMPSGSASGCRRTGNG